MDICSSKKIHLRKLRSGRIFQHFAYENQLKKVHPDLFRRYYKVLSNMKIMCLVNPTIFARGENF